MTLSVCCLALAFESSDRGYRGDGVQRHVDDRGYAACRGGARRRLEAFPVRAPRLVDVHVRVDQAGKDGQVAEVMRLITFAGTRIRVNRGDDAVFDVDAGIAFTVRRHDAS